MKQLTVTKTDAGQRFDKYLMRRLPNAGKSFLYKMLRKKNIVLNGKKAEGNETLAEGDEVKLFFADETYEKFSGISNDGFMENGKYDNGTANISDNSNRALNNSNLASNNSNLASNNSNHASNNSSHAPNSSNHALNNSNHALNNSNHAPNSSNHAPSNSDYGSNQSANTQGKPYKFKVVYENDHILAIDKPAGMLSQKANPEDISAVEYIAEYLSKSNVKDHGFKPGVSNRLDRNTSGLLLAGKTVYGQRVLAKMLQERSIEKYYLCLVKGEVHKADRIESFLTKDNEKNTVKISTQSGEEKIITAYRPIAVTELGTLLEVELITGKSHQIRAQMAYLGHPIAGDAKYGDKEYNAKLKERFGVRHQTLHAFRMVFPECAEPLEELSNKEIKTELPKEIMHFCKAFGIVL